MDRVGFIFSALLIVLTIFCYVQSCTDATRQQRSSGFYEHIEGHPYNY